MSPLEELVLVPVDTGALEAADGAEDSTALDGAAEDSIALDEAEVVAKTPADSD